MAEGAGKRGFWAIWWEFPRAVHARLLVVQRCASPDGDPRRCNDWRNHV